MKDTICNQKIVPVWNLLRLNMFKVTLKLLHFYLHEVNMIIESAEDYSQIWANSTFQRNKFHTGTIFWLHMVSFMWMLSPVTFFKFSMTHFLTWPNQIKLFFNAIPVKVLYFVNDHKNFKSSGWQKKTKAPFIPQWNFKRMHSILIIIFKSHQNLI
jgi:hypothetical protein